MATAAALIEQNYFAASYQLKKDRQYDGMTRSECATFY